MGCRTYRDNLACYFLSKKREEKLTLKKCKGKINYLDHFLFTCEAHQELFDACIGRPRGDDPNHVILGDAHMAMAKRVLDPPEAERWPFAKANNYMKKYLTLIPEQSRKLESDL